MPTDVHLVPTSEGVALKEALERMRPVLEAMPPLEVLRVTLDAERASAIVIGSLPRIEKYCPAMVTQFGEQATVYLDELPIIARATRQTEIELTASDSVKDLSGRFAQIAEDHQLLLTDAEALANRKLLDRTRVDAGRPSQGYRTTVTSTLVLVALLRERWPDIKDKTPLTREELDEIEGRAQAMAEQLDKREQGSTRLPAEEMRTRALSKLVRTYGEVQRMLTFVRWWEDDAEDIAPSLWAGRKRRAAPVEEVEPVEAPVASPPVPALPPPVDPNSGGPFTQ